MNPINTLIRRYNYTSKNDVGNATKCYGYHSTLINLTRVLSWDCTYILIRNNDKRFVYLATANNKATERQYFVIQKPKKQTIQLARFDNTEIKPET